MRLEATVVFKLRASSLSEAGAALDDVLARAHERDDVEVERVGVTAPPGGVSVSLPAVTAPEGYPPGAPHPDSG